MADLAGPPPPLLAPPPPVPAATRVALGLLLYGGFDLTMGGVMLAGSFATNASDHQINLVPGFVIYWIGAWLVWKGKRAIWPLLAFLSALTLGVILGSVLGAGLGLPDGLAGAFFRHEPFWFWFYCCYGLVAMIFAGWLLAESLARRAHWRAGATPAWLQPKALFVAGAVLGAASTWGVFALLQAGWTKPLVARARAEYGEDRHYLPIRYGSSSRDGQMTHEAVVLVYSENTFRKVSLHWTD